MYEHLLSQWRRTAAVKSAVDLPRGAWTRGLGPTHDPSGCVVCQSLTTGLVRRASESAPHPNPHGGSSWYHGTAFDPQSDPRGNLKVMPRGEEYRHWNTDLGVHFSSSAEVAGQFAHKDDSPHGRVAHAELHMHNPAHFADEHELGSHAIEWARGQGHRRVPEGPEEREHYMAQGGMEALTHGAIDRKGPRKSHDLMDLDTWLGEHPHRDTITSGYRQHLQSQGHDGITYGNDYEGPKGHTCAIAFPETPVHIRKWDRGQ